METGLSKHLFNRWTFSSTHTITVLFPIFLKFLMRPRYFCVVELISGLQTFIKSLI